MMFVLGKRFESKRFVRVQFRFVCIFNSGIREPSYPNERGFAYRNIPCNVGHSMPFIWEHFHKFVQLFGAHEQHLETKLQKRKTRLDFVFFFIFGIFALHNFIFI